MPYIFNADEVESETESAINTFEEAIDEAFKTFRENLEKFIGLNPTEKPVWQSNFGQNFLNALPEVHGQLTNAIAEANNNMKEFIKAEKDFVEENEGRSVSTG